MIYLKRKVKKGKLKEIGEFYGLELKPRGPKGALKVKRILICDTDMKNKYIRKQLDKKFSGVCDKIYDFLISEDDSEDGVKACLGEIEKLKSVIFNKYKEHMKNKMYKEFLAKIVIAENEFRNKYREREFFSKLINDTFKSFNNINNYEEEMEKGRSR